MHWCTVLLKDKIAINYEIIACKICWDDKIFQQYCDYCLVTFTLMLDEQLPFLANSRSRSLFAVARPSVCLWTVCLSSVCNARAPYSGGWNFRQYDSHIIFYKDRPKGTPPPGELNTRGVVKYSDFGPIEGYISERCRIGGKLVLITNRKSYMSFRLVSKSATLDDLERPNSPYSALFHRIWWLSRRTV